LSEDDEKVLDFPVKNSITEKGNYRMAEKTNTGKGKKTSRGMRKHLRRVKQESRKAGTPVSEWKKKVRTQPIAKKRPLSIEDIFSEVF
jgi:hypothetical protein